MRIGDLGSPLASGLTILHLACLVPLLVYPDFAVDYPYLGGDTWDYLRNALAIGGIDLDYTGRPPLLPLIMAALNSAGVLGLLPVLFLCVHHAFALMMFAELVSTSKVAAWTGWGILLLGAAGLRWAIYLEPSLIGAYLLAASVLLISGRWSRHPAAPYLGGVLAGSAYLLHQLALIFPAIACLAALLGRRRPAILAVLVFLPFPSAWLALKALVFSSAGDLGVSHWGLLRWHTDAVVPYLVTGMAMFGLPLVATSLFGLVRGCRARYLTVALSATTMAVVLLFFVFCYDYLAQRFLLYVLPFMVVLAACALAATESRLLAAALGILLVWVAVHPRSRGETRKTIPLLPGVYLQTEIRLNPRARGPLERVRLALKPPAVLTSHSPYSRLLASRRARPTAPAPLRLPPSETTADLYLLAPGELNLLGLRSRVQVLLERRVHLVPLAVVEDLVCSLRPRRLGVVAGTAVWGATLPDGRTTTLSHRADGSPLTGFEGGTCEGDSTAFDVEAAADLGSSWSDRNVGILVDKVDALLGLALFFTRAELHVVAPGQAPATRRTVLDATGGADAVIVVDGVPWRALVYRGAPETAPAARASDHLR